MLPKKGTSKYEVWILTLEYKEFCKKLSNRGKSGGSPKRGTPEYESWVLTPEYAELCNRMKGYSNPTFGRSHGGGLPKKGTLDYERWVLTPEYEEHCKRVRKMGNGKSRESYPLSFDNTFKKFYRMLYGNVCFKCGKTPIDNGMELSVHHYDYDKNSKNCVPVCIGCNIRANFDRDYWERYYTSAVEEYWNWFGRFD